MLDAAYPARRILEIHSHATLALLHQALVALFQWHAGHRHRFTLDSDAFRPGARAYIDAGDGRGFAHERTAHRDDRALVGRVLRRPGDRLFYTTDYAHPLQVEVRLQRVEPADPDAPAVRCVGGAGTAPADRPRDLDPEAVPQHPHRSRPRQYVRLRTVPPIPEVRPESRAGVPFDLDGANLALSDPRVRLCVLPLDGRAVDLVERVAALTMLGGPDLEARLIAVGQDLDPTPSQADARRLLAPHLWFLRRVGPEGIRLTRAGYLQPALVQQVVDVVPGGGDWTGNRGREWDCYPVLDFRLCLEDLGLLRERHHWLLLTRAAQAGLDDPRALWRQIASRLVVGKLGTFEQRCQVLALVYVATGCATDEVPFARIADLMDALGWEMSDDSPIDPDAVRTGCFDMFAVLEGIGDPRGVELLAAAALRRARVPSRP